jgi:DNA polymerase III gamma/tau subunit
MSSEFYKRFRPKSLKTVIGQDGAVASLQKLIDKGTIPHAILLTGPSGCGKTTIGRILKETLNCGDSDYLEINSADFKGIDMVRDVRRSMNLSPISGDTRIWLVDEAHKLTSDAQNAFLKLLEDTPEHVYFLLATTDPQKLIKTIHTRCTEVRLVSLSGAALTKVLQRVIEKESLSVSADVVEEIIEAADGSARKALVILQQVAMVEGDEAQVKAIQSTTFTKDQAIDLARLLITTPNPTWGDAAKILRALKDEDVEGIRYCVLGYARSCMVGAEGKAPNLKLGERAFKIIDIFGRNFYDSKQAGLAAACWEVICCK